jgi:hypothetical protein
MFDEQSHDPVYSLLFSKVNKFPLENDLWWAG